MALPEQAVNRLGREAIQAPGWSGQILMFSVTVFFIGLAVYFGLVLGYKPYLEGQVAALDKQIETFNVQIPKDEQAKLVSFYSQVINLQNILANHPVPSKIMAWLERNTSKNIYYSKMTMTAFPGTLNEVQMNISGFAKAPEDFSKQIVTFQTDPFVKRFIINNFSSPAGGTQWRFEVTLFMSGDVISQTATTTAPGA